MRTGLGASLLVLILGLGVAGCGDDAPAAKPEPTASPSPTTPPGLDDVAPRKPGDATDTGPSAVAYARYFAQLVQYSVRIRSARPVAAEAFDQARCTTCTTLATFVHDLVSGGYWEIGDDLDIGALRALSVTDGMTVAGSFVYPAAKYVELDGADKGDVSAKNYHYEVDLVWDRPQERWRVRDYTFKSLGPVR